MEKWLVAHTKPRAEFRTRDVLQRYDDVAVFLPLVSVAHHGRPCTVEPLFPRYLFVRMDPLQAPPDLWQTTPGLLGFVKFGDTFAHVSAEVIRTIQERVATVERRGGLPAHDFQPGETVRIRSGALQGLFAVFEGPLTPGQRATVLVDFLRNGCRVQLPIEDLEPVSPASSARRGRRTRGRGRRIRDAHTRTS